MPDRARTWNAPVGYTASLNLSVESSAIEHDRGKPMLLLLASSPEGLKISPRDLL